MESVSPKHLIIPLGPFRNFRKFEEIFAAQGAPPVSLTPGANGKKSSIRKALIIFFTPLGSRVNIRINFFHQIHFEELPYTGPNRKRGVDLLEKALRIKMFTTKVRYQKTPLAG
jgi:hypothetical protein